MYVFMSVLFVHVTSHFRSTFFELICKLSDRRPSNLERMSLSIEDKVIDTIVVGLEHIVLFKFVSFIPTSLHFLHRVLKLTGAWMR